MTRSALGGSLPAAETHVASPLAGAVLARLLVGSASLAEVARDLAPLTAHKAGDATWRDEVAREIDPLVVVGHVQQVGSSLSLTSLGQSTVRLMLGGRAEAGMDWAIVRDVMLVARALGIEAAASSRRKALTKIDGLRALIVEKAFGLRGKGKPNATRIRSELAALALGRAFGSQVKSEFKGKTALPAKAARLLAGQLSQKPRDFKTDARLVAVLASEAVGATRSDIAHLRQCVLRRFLSGEPIGNLRAIAAKLEQATAPATPKARVAGPLPTAQHQPPARPHPVAAETPAAPEPASAANSGAVRPDPNRFASVVIAAARDRAEGWAGNRKAFVSHVWSSVRERFPEWGLSEIEFKCMLTEAHRAGLVALANADLKDKRYLKEVEESAIAYKNTIWHYVRVID